MILRRQVRTAIRTALLAAAPFAARSVLTILDDGSSAVAQAMEEQLRTRGMVLVATPFLGSEVRDKPQGRVLERATLAIHIRTNPAVNASSTGAQIDPDDAVDAVISALIALGLPEAALEGLEPGEGEKLTELVPGDIGLLTTAVYASVRFSIS